MEISLKQVIDQLASWSRASSGARWCNGIYQLPLHSPEWNLAFIVNVLSMVLHVIVLQLAECRLKIE